MNNYYYSGEFGYFNVVILPALEKYNDTKITIYTFPDYCYIIKNLFGNKFNCKEIPLTKLRLLHDNLEEAVYKKYTPINNLLNAPCIWEMTNFERISKKISTEFSLEDKPDNYICYFPRFRDSGEVITNFAERNSTEYECEFILNLFNKNNIKIYILGKEILDFDYKKYNVEKVENIEQSIYYLQNCKYLISNDSGYIDFAKNCGCKKILILRPIEDYHNRFNPFNCSQYIIDNVKQLETFI
jgi:ADP-heptose:LPS heptosyltransferase